MGKVAKTIMPRAITSIARRSTQDVETREIWLILMEIDHSSLAEPFYLVNNSEKITVTGTPDIDYLAYPFSVILGNDDGEKLPTVNIEFDNVDRLLIETIRSISDSPDITIKLVLASQPEEVEIEISDLKLREITYDMYKISGILYADDILNQKWPKDVVSKAAGYLGLFK